MTNLTPTSPDATAEKLAEIARLRASAENLDSAWMGSKYASLSDLRQWSAAYRARADALEAQLPEANYEDR